MIGHRVAEAHNQGMCLNDCVICEYEAADDTTYYCGMCDQRVDRTTDPSPCEEHRDPVGPCCSPCDDCADEAIEAAAIDERRSA